VAPNRNVGPLDEAARTTKADKKRGEPSKVANRGSRRGIDHGVITFKEGTAASSSQDVLPPLDCGHAAEHKVKEKRGRGSQKRETNTLVKKRGAMTSVPAAARRYNVTNGVHPAEGAGSATGLKGGG